MKPANNMIHLSWQLLGKEKLLPIFYWIFFFGLSLWTSLNYDPLPEQFSIQSSNIWFGFLLIHFIQLMVHLLTSLNIHSFLSEGELVFPKVFHSLLKLLFNYLLIYLVGIFFLLLFFIPLLAWITYLPVKWIVFLILAFLGLLFQDWLVVLVVKSNASWKLCLRWFVFVLRYQPKAFWSYIFLSVVVHLFAYTFILQISYVPWLGVNFLTPLALGLFYTWKIALLSLFLYSIFDQGAMV